MFELDRIEIVDNALQRLTTQLRRRNIDGALGLFHDDAVLFGSEEGEQALGTGELRAFLMRLFDRPHTYGWAGWDGVLTGGTQDTLWFVAPAMVVVRDDAGGETASPYRLSGVLERGNDGRWLFRLFNGSEPVGTSGQPRT